MAGNWGINAFLALLASLFTFFSSIFNNTWQTSLLRAIIGFLLFFLLGYMIRFAMHQNSSNKRMNSVQQEQKPVGENSVQTEQFPEETPAFQSIPLNSLHNEGMDQTQKTGGDTR